MKIRSRAPNAAQRRDLECVCVLQCWIVLRANPRDERTSRVRTEPMNVRLVNARENELPHRVVCFVELGYPDADKTLPSGNWRTDEQRGELVRLVQERSAVAVGAKARPEPRAGIWRHVLKKTATTLL